MMVVLPRLMRRTVPIREKKQMGLHVREVDGGVNESLYFFCHLLLSLFSLTPNIVLSFLQQKTTLYQIPISPFSSSGSQNRYYYRKVELKNSHCVAFLQHNPISRLQSPNSLSHSLTWPWTRALWRQLSSPFPLTFVVSLADMDFGVLGLDVGHPPLPPPQLEIASSAAAQDVVWMKPSKIQRTSDDEQQQDVDFSPPNRTILRSNSTPSTHFSSGNQSYYPPPAPPPPGMLLNLSLKIQSLSRNGCKL